MSRLLAVPLALALYLHLVVLGLISLGWNTAAMLLYPLLPARRRLAVGRAGIAHGYAVFWRLAAWTGMLKIDSSALDALRNERGIIVVANHPSMLDALILVARLPRSACIMKAELMRNVFLGAGARLAGYIRNDSARGMIRLAVEDLKHGGQLVIFPEGTRTTQQPVNPFRPGVTLIAKLANAPIQTVFIDTDSPYLGKGWPIWRLPPLPIVFKVRLGQRFAPQKDSDALLAEMEQYFAAGVKPPRRPSAP
ncbi:lysophospholipid acyltransferase family protein [Ideonella sp. BN130291]|uniref:lysophospholipid acyltransferase family protein n=1 Tax=Ideonella sp. BN130291 TaxID=3112940 RepID=UPI002E2717D2|nr:lysophospholipid acyltransferase family protein [Ideonella sp. BN130291]